MIFLLYLIQSEGHVYNLLTLVSLLHPIFALVIFLKALLNLKLVICSL